MRFVETIGEVMAKPAVRNMLPMQQGDVPRTFASSDLRFALKGFKPEIGIDIGIRRFVEWYNEIY